MSEFFFQEEDVKDVALNHIEEIKNLSDRESERILKAYRRVRQELRDRLDVFSLNGKDGTFTAQKTRGALMQVDLAIETMNKNLLNDMNSAAQSASELGIDNLITEIEKYNKVFTGAIVPINIDAAVVASETKNLLFSQYESSMQAYGQMTRQRMAQALTQGTLEQLNLSEMIPRLGMALKAEEWKLEQIVRTELHNVYSVGKLNGMFDLWDEGKGQIPDLMKTLYHPMDHRTGKDSILLNKNNPIVPLDEPFEETSTGKKLVYMAPPNRPNDRAILIPFREGWKQ